MLIALIVIGFTAGFVDSIAGGGGLISLPALLAMGFPPHLALGTNKFIGISTAIASSSRFAFARRFEMRKSIPHFLAALTLSVIGSFTATRLDPKTLEPFILFGLIGVGLYTIRRRHFGLQGMNENHKAALWLLPACALLGFYDGFFGPGTGIFLMMAFVLLGGRDILSAAANSRMVNLGSNLGAILLFSSTGYVNFQYALPAAIASFVGGMLGANLTLRNGARLIRPFFLFVTWSLIAKVAWDLFQAR